MTKTLIFILLLFAATNVVAQGITFAYDKAGDLI